MSRSSRLALLCLILVAAMPALARDTVPTPAGGGPGSNVLPADQANPTDLPAPGYAELPGLPSGPLDKTGSRYDDIGGDDVPVVTVNYAYDKDLAVASNGDLFAIVKFADVDQGDYEFVIHRSDDGGTTWREWAEFDDPTPGYRFWRPEIHVAEGIVDRVFVVYTLDTGSGNPREVHVAWSPLDLEDGDFSNDTTVFSATHDYVLSPSFATDAATWNEYYCYLTFSADNGDGHDIYFVRSLDQGTSWEPHYILGAISVGDRGYYSPQVAIGYGGWVHVAWFLGFGLDHEYDNTIRYRRCPNYGAGGLANWENMQSITPHTDDIDMISTRLAASLVSPDLAMAYLRRERYPDGSFAYDGILTFSSDDAGVSWSDPNTLGSGFEWLGDLLHQESTDCWLMGVTDPSWGYRWTSVASPAAWSEPIEFADHWYSSGEPSLVVDPSRDGRIGILGGGSNTDSYTFYFDAEWRADPGYPNLEDGFPVDLPGAPVSDPAVVDLDGDGDLEIVFAAQNEVIFAYHHDGTEVAGFPRGTGFLLSDSPVCVGDLNGDGAMEIVVGTTNGVILAYDAAADLLPGWPYLTGYSDPVYLAIGSIGGPYPRAVIWGCGPRLAVLDYHGEPYPGALGRGFASLDFSQPPSIGDIDGDGRSEVVIGIGSLVYAFRMMESGTVMSAGVGSAVSGPLSLGDFDQDGDVEVVVPTAAGEVHLLDDDGSPFPGSWPVTAAAQAINGAAIASCLGTTVPEIAVSALGLRVSVLFADGDVASGWPVNTDGWNVYGMPVIGEVEGSNDVIIGARGRKAWSWSNFGQVNDGWPKAVSDHIYQTPAYGDLDQDGSAEVVFLSLDQLVVVDVNNSPSSSYRLWAMAGHDHERSGCADCAADVVAVEDAPTGVTRVSMAAPWPNPIAGQATFAYAVPIRARVDLAIYDVRGRRIATVHRAEETAGQHVIGWNGRDRDGRPVASGQYVAALKVTGPGVDETVSRKVTVLR